MILDDIVAEKRREHARRPPIALDALWTQVQALPPPRDFANALRSTTGAATRGSDRGAPRVIAEFKRRSPSAGAIRPNADPAVIAPAYAAAGAAALSVLTDVPFFDGALAHVQVAKRACPLPILRKDFLLDERDLLEARLAGADAALLIVRLLDAATLRVLLDVATRAQLHVLVEAHNDAEIATALAAGARIVGVNHRDLDTLVIDLSLSARARAAAPSAILVAESGIQTPAHVAQMREHGADAILVGEALMRAIDPGAALRELTR
ncbi:MAG TPA: indole-3-glycerol phosphate synthase TrpC [Polyangia bacterium]|nr:indole-3-glycerol phosphate synthase TrpC [Polyangia bacterium]